LLLILVFIDEDVEAIPGTLSFRAAKAFGLLVSDGIQAVQGDAFS